MSVIFSDTFDAVLDGTNWVQQNNTWAWQSGGVVRCTATSASPHLLRTTTSAHAAIANCRATLTQKNGAGGADSGVMVRDSTAAGASNTCYYHLLVAASNTSSIFRRNAGTDTLVGASDTIVSVANGVVAIEASGTGATVTLKKFYQGVQVLGDLSDTSGSRIVSTGQCGVFNWNNGNNTNTDFDNFIVDDLVDTHKYLLVRN